MRKGNIGSIHFVSIPERKSYFHILEKMVHEIWVSDTDDYQDVRLVKCESVWFDIYIEWFQGIFKPFYNEEDFTALC
jgi:hypothetical protein